MIPTRINQGWLVLLLFVEIAGFIIVGKYLGVMLTLLLILATIFLGFIVLRLHGFLTMAKLQRSLNIGEHPGIGMLQGTLLMFSGILLVIPGFVSDFIGLLLLIPQVRKWVVKLMVKKGLAGPKAKTKAEKKSRVIEGEFHRED